MGYFLQFGIFSLIMQGAIKIETKELIKKKLAKVSTLCPYVSLEAIEKLLMSMKTLNFNKIKKEFVLLTHFHGQEFFREIEEMNVPEEMKEGFKTIIKDFLEDVTEVTETADMFSEN